MCLMLTSCAWGRPTVKPQAEAPIVPAKQAVVSSVLSSAIDSPPAPQKNETVKPQNTEELARQIDALTRKVEALESKLATAEPAKSVTSVAVTPKTVEHIGSALTTAPSRSDPEAGFINDAAVKDFRAAKVLFDAKKHTEAVLAFSNFLEKYPDHALAGSAQFYIGVSYSNQNEPKLALHELERVLTSYDRSVPVAETLRRMAELEDSLKLTADAQKHRQLLNSLFAQSPAAATTAANTQSKPAANPSLDEPPPPTAPIPQTPTEGKSH